MKSPFFGNIVKQENNQKMLHLVSHICRKQSFLRSRRTFSSSQIVGKETSISNVSLHDYNVTNKEMRELGRRTKRSTQSSKRTSSHSGFISSKGISPLIAAVLLIAITMAIAGLMATFATNISATKLLQAERCSPTLSLLDLEFNNGNITTRIANNNKNNAMEGIEIFVVYNDPGKNKENIPLSTYAPKDSLNPLERMTIVIPTNDTTKPRRIEITSTTCEGITISGNF